MRFYNKHTLLILCGIVIIYIILLLYFYFTSKFWYSQPVFHYYDIHRHVIATLFPINSSIRYIHNTPHTPHTCHKKLHTETYDLLTMPQYNRQQWIYLIQNHYLQNGENVWIPNASNIVPYFIGTGSSFITMLFNPIPQTMTHTYLIAPSAPLTQVASHAQGSLKPVKHATLFGTITSRLTTLYLYPNVVYPAYYVDYLCVNKNYRKKSYAAALIANHHNEQSQRNPNVIISVFKREDELTNIVPLTTYTTYGFPIDQLQTPLTLQPHEKVVNYTTAQQIHDIYPHIIQELSQTCFAFLLTSLNNLIELVTSKNIYIWGLHHSNNIIAFYFFRNTCIYFDKKQLVISAFASIQSNACSLQDFIHGWQYAMTATSTILQTTILAIEDIGKNIYITKYILNNINPIVQSPTAYYFHCFIHSTISSKNCCVIV